jgi:hypothetical protein
MAEIRGGGLSPGSFLDKLSTDQLGKLIDQSDQEDTRQHQLRRERNWMTFGFLVTVLILIGFLCWLFLSYEKGDLLREIIALFIGLGGGGVGGYSVGRFGKSSQ